jgi:PAS domain S-box-containing protein
MANSPEEPALDSPLRSTTRGDDGSQVLWEDDGRVFSRDWLLDADGRRRAVLTVRLAAEHPLPASIDRLAHEFALKEELESAWAVRPVDLRRDRDRTILVLEDSSCEPLHRLLGAPMEIGKFLRVAIAIVTAVRTLHQRGLVHKDLKPPHILIDSTCGSARLTGFGIASRLSRERQAPDPPELIAGTLAYMAPEQTGRINRSIDSRSDLYALGTTFYQMLTGRLPFTAANPMEWVHCHIAREPVTPSERVKEIPGVVSAIVMKLLAKAAEDRYQSAAGLEADLGRCSAAWLAERWIDDFALGERDTPERLLFPEKLYGRAAEVEALGSAFDRIVKGGAPELVLVSGYSGVGKSSVVNEWHKALWPPRGLFTSGKFDQYKRDIPYATLVQAFRSLVRTVLSKSDLELASWRNALLEALGPNGRLMTDLVPELSHIIGEQPPVQELEPQQAQSRFQLVFGRFIGALTQPEHPLVLFLDDLQWLDAATLDLLETLLTRPDVLHLMLIGAYRDNEVNSTHPLARRLEAIRKSGAAVRDIVLAPLRQDDLEQLIADTLHSGLETSAPLARLVHEKTSGNPFFALQFISELAEERLLTFDHGEVRWAWDLERIHAKRYTDNVVDLMVGKLTRLPLEVQRALQQLACLGNTAEITMLLIVLKISEPRVHDALWPAVRQGMIERVDGFYRFVHDRVQEAAYSMIPQEMRAEIHLLVGRLLLGQTNPDKQEEAIFEIVSQLNRGARLMDSPGEREQLAELNLTAGKRAKVSAAYVPALSYFVTGAALLAEDSWERRHELTFSLELSRAECEFHTGAFTQAEQRLAALTARAATTVERAGVTCMLADLYTTMEQSSRAIAVSLDYLRHLGDEWSPRPTDDQVRREYDRIWSTMRGRQIEALLELPLMSDPASLATMDVLTRLSAPAWYSDADLAALVICRVVNLSLEGGNCDGSCYAYVVLGLIAIGRFGDYEAGFRFGRLGSDLVERRGLTRFQARTQMIFGSVVMPWTKHVRAGRDLIRCAFEAANKIGDLTFAGYCCNHLNTNLLAAGDSLDDTQREAERGLAFVQKIQFAVAEDAIAPQIALIRMLRGLTPKFGRLDDERFTESRIEHRFAVNRDLAGGEGMYWTRKLQARFYAGDHAAALEASEMAERTIWASLAHFETAEHLFYTALARAAFCERLAPEQRPPHLEALGSLLEIWADNCPANFENRAALVSAEMARLENRDLDAMRLYEKAIRSARDNGFVHNEAIAHERASSFYRARGFDQFAELYLRNAHYRYLSWGADGKVQQLEDMYPHLKTEERARDPTSTVATPVDRLDLATVIKVSQAVSGEIVQGKLINILMRTAIEQAGAQRGLLILPDAGELWIAAEATTRGETVVVRRGNEPLAGTAMPETVFNYALRSGEIVILDDATAQLPFGADPYVRQHRARSILCLPLMNQAEVTGALYLENNLTPGAFTSGRVEVLKLLASQAAISLKNTLLYRDLERREARIRRLVDANIIGICISRPNGDILEANDAFLKTVQYDRADFLAGRLRWIELTAPESVERTKLALEELESTGIIQPFEKEYIRKDGSRVPVLVGVAGLDDERDLMVAFVLDLSERKRAEEEARENERRYHEIRGELAHANRMTTMGQLTASIAHEVSQPIGASITNAQAALRWLDRPTPDLEEVRLALGRIVRDGSRASAVVDRIRDLAKKSPRRRAHVEINMAITEVIEITRSEALKNGVSVRAELEDELPTIDGDRVELQQVILNLILNAIEAMSETEGRPRELVISTERAVPDLLVTVRDTGSGLSSESLERAFDAFYTTKADGMGMGLSICRSIIEAHGGRLWVSANAPRGAVFQFTAPANSDRARSLGEGSPDRSIAGAQQGRAQSMMRR